jgi:hypothetical protein
MANDSKAAPAAFLCSYGNFLSCTDIGDDQSGDHQQRAYDM